MKFIQFTQSLCLYLLFLDYSLLMWCCDLNLKNKPSSTCPCLLDLSSLIVFTRELDLIKWSMCQNKDAFNTKWPGTTTPVVPIHNHFFYYFAHLNAVIFENTNLTVKHIYTLMLIYILILHIVPEELTTHKSSCKCPSHQRRVKSEYGDYKCHLSSTVYVSYQTGLQCFTLKNWHAIQMTQLSRFEQEFPHCAWHNS